MKEFNTLNIRQTFGKFLKEALISIQPFIACFVGFQKKKKRDEISKLALKSLQPAAEDSLQILRELRYG